MLIEPIGEKTFYKIIDDICKKEKISKKIYFENVLYNDETFEDGRIAGWVKEMQNDYNWTNEYSISFAKRLELELFKIEYPRVKESDLKLSDFDNMYNKKVE